MPNSTIAALCLLAAFTGEAWAAAARVDFTYGSVTVAGPDGAERPLARGAELDNDQVVRTAEGRAQLRFADGAYVSLQPHSEFAIRDYRFNGKTDGAERGFFALTKGAMRTVTGLIGRVNRDRYKVDTPTATIGIRGTGGVIQVLEDGSTLVVGTSGIWSLTNAAGTVDVPAGVSALSPASPDTAPQQTSRQPQAGPAPLPQASAFQQGEQRGAEDTLAGLVGPGGGAIEEVQPLASGGGYAAATAFGALPSGALQAVLLNQAPVTANFDTLGRLTEFTNADGEVLKLDPTLGSHAEFGTDGILAWGRWTGRVSGQFPCDTPTCLLDRQYGPNEGLHYVVGLPTAALPTQGGAKYFLLGATAPTFVDGRVPAGSFSGSLDVQFGAAASITTVDWTVGIGGRTYRIDNTTMSTSSSAFSTPSPVNTTGCASSPCQSSISGFFAGPNAERIGASYAINDGGVVNQPNITGAAAFKKQ